MNIEDYIQSINDSDTKLRVLEVGTGTPIANNFFKYSGASKTIYSSESYYAREAFDEKFGICQSRAVSAERLNMMLWY